MTHSKKRYIVVFHAVTEEGEEQKFVKVLTETSSTQVRAKLNAEFINVKIHSLRCMEEDGIKEELI